MPGVAKQINGVFVWKVTKDGKDAGKMISDVVVAAIITRLSVLALELATYYIR